MIPPAARALLACCVLLQGACLFFEDRIYCDDETPCPDGSKCGAGGVCPGPGEDPGEDEDGGAQADAGGSVDAGQAQDGGGGEDAGPAADGGAEVPTQPAVSIEPAAPGTLDDLVAVLLTESTSSSGGTISYRYEWRKDDAVQADLVSSTVPASRTLKGETWSVSVTPLLGAVEGPAGTAQTTIVNTRPSLQGVALYPIRPRRGETLTAVAVGLSDPDPGDSPTVTYRWFADSGGGNEDLEAETSTPTFQTTDVFALRMRVEAIPRDGTAGTPVASPPRDIADVSTPTWRIHHPTRVIGDILFGSRGYLELDAARDRLLVLTTLGGGSYGSWEYSLRAEPAWSHLGLLAPDELFFATELVLPDGRYLRLNGARPEAVLTPVEATWILDLAQQGAETWTPLALQDAPASPRAGMSAVYDPVGDRVITYGGLVLDNGVDVLAVDETWAISLQEGAGAWSQLPASPVEAPSGRFGAPAVYDAEHHQVVVYGGFGGTFPDVLVPYADVLVLPLGEDPLAWRRVAAAGGPPARALQGVALDAAGGRLVVLGGCDLQDCENTVSSELHALSLAPGQEQWEVLPLDATLSGPVLGMVADERRGTFYVLVNRGEADGSNLGAFEILELEPRPAGTAWHLEKLWSSTDDVPPGRSQHAVALDTVEDGRLYAIYGGRFVRNAGNPDVVLDDVWRFDPATGDWALVPQSGAQPSARNSFAFAHAGLLGGSELPLLLDGGRCEVAPGLVQPCAGTFQARLLSEGIVWESHQGATAPGARFGHGMLARYLGSPQEYLLWSGMEGSTTFADQWRFTAATTGALVENGAWSQLTATAVPARAFAATTLINDTTPTRVLSLGGVDAGGTLHGDLHASEAFAPQPAWEPVTTVGDALPSALAGASLVRGEQDHILFGGEVSSFTYSDAVYRMGCYVAGAFECQLVLVEKPAGALWPSGRAYHGAAWDRVRQVLWVQGGMDDRGRAERETWSFGPVR